MARSSKASATAIFDLKSATLTVLALMLKTPDLDLLAMALAARYGQDSGLFDREPVCIDLSALRESDAVLDMARLVALLRPHGLNPIAARGGSAAQMEAAREAGLAEAPDAVATLPAAAPAAAPVAEADAQVAVSEPEGAPESTNVAASPEAPAPVRSSALIIDKPLRSGQQVYARGGDLIVLAVVSFGAEVIADGSIHVYAPLRGRALAGARGDTAARIFAACMEPQLVSIAGTWRTFEAGLPADVAGKPAQLRLVGDTLRFDPLKF